jgi:hypothetical protein
VLVSIKKLRHFVSRVLLSALVFAGVLSGRYIKQKGDSALSVPDRIAAVQKAARQLRSEIGEPFIHSAQWGNWGNFANWNNWGNWANWNNWNNWGNWGNWSNV